MSFESLMSGFIGALVGGLLTGFFSLSAIKRSEKFARETAQSNDAETIRSLLQAIHDELDVVYDRYQQSMGAHVESLPDGNPLLIYYPIANEYFTVFNCNAHLIGRIKDNDLRRSIIRTYTLSKGLVDTFRMNNYMVDKFEQSHSIANDSGNEMYKSMAQQHYTALVAYGASIKQSHQQAKSEHQALMRMLHKQGVLAEP